MHDGEPMPEILTESFCERCGTRYTFEAAAPSRGRFGRLRVASRGLRNYVLSDESSLEEAFAEARSDDERTITSQQLDAFHKTFNFCMSCRQYTCANCWNTVESRCLTCAPHLGTDVLPAPFPTLDPRAGMVAAAPATGNGHSPDGSADAWPVIDLPGDSAPIEAASTPEPGPTEAPLEPSIVDAPGAGVVPASAATASADAATAEGATTEGATTDLRAAAAAAETAALLSRFRPGDSLDDALEAYEAQADQAASPEPALEPEPARVAAELSETAGPTEVPAVAGAAAPSIADTTAALVDEPAADEPAAPAAEVANVGAAAEEPAAIVEVPLPADAAPPPAAAAAATTPEPEPEAEIAETERPARLAAAAAAWQVVAPDHGDQPVPPAPSDTPAWPALPPGSEAPQWPPAPANVPSPSALPGGSDLLWAASSRDVLGQQPAAGQPTAAVQPCVSCGLALSATARFCRRCGTRQG